MKNALYTLILLCCGLFVAACEVAPTDFDDPSASTATFPLKQIKLNDVELFVAAQGFSTKYCLIDSTDSSALAQDSIPGFDTLHTFTGNLYKVDDQWLLDLRLEVTFPEDGVVVLVGLRDPQPHGFILELDSIEISDESVQNGSIACPHGSAQMKVAVLESYWNPPNPVYIIGWKDFEELPATLKLDLHVEEISSEQARVVGGIKLFSEIEETGSGYDNNIVYTLTAQLELE